MNRAEHYRAAEQLIREADDRTAAMNDKAFTSQQFAGRTFLVNTAIALAQVHATLATVELSVERGIKP